MIIKDNDQSNIRYQMDLIPVLKRHNMDIHAYMRARHRLMMLHGLVLCEDGNIREVENATYLLPNYTLYLEERLNGVVLHKIEVLSGTHAHDPDRCWKILRQYEYFAFSDVEGILQDHNFPNPDAFDKRLREGLHHYAHYNNLISRRDFDTNRVELVDYKECPYQNEKPFDKKRPDHKWY